MSSTDPDRRSDAPRAWLRASCCLAGLFLLALAIALPGNGARRPLSAHEVLVARSAEEMAQRGELAIPYFDDEVRLQKPPVSYWLAMLSARICGGSAPGVQSEFSARLPSIVLGACTTTATACLGWVLFDSLALGAFAALLFATCGAYIEWARSAQPEMAYTLGCTLFVLAAAAARRAAMGRRSTWIPALAGWTALAFAVLAKGPLVPAMLLCGMALGWRRREVGRGFASALHVVSGSAWMLLLVVPYFAYVAWQVPGAVDFWRAQMFARTGGVESAWWRPLELFYVGQGLGLTLPWSGLLLLVPWWLWRESRRAKRGLGTSFVSASELAQARWLAWCALAPLVCLSFSVGRKGYYLLPVIPLACVAMAWAGARAFESVHAGTRAERWRLFALRSHGVVFALAAVACIELLVLMRSWLGIAAPVWWLLCAVLVLAILFAIQGVRVARDAPRLGAGMLLACAALGSFGFGASGIHSRPRLYSEGKFAREVASRTDEQRPLVVLDKDKQVLCFYTHRVVTSISEQQLARELESEPAPWIVTNESRIPELGVDCRVVAREDRPARDDPRVLVDPLQRAR